MTSTEAERIEDINSQTDSVIGRDFQKLSAEEQERKREEWKAELKKTEENILTLKQDLIAEERHAEGLKRRLKITANDDPNIPTDINHWPRLPKEIVLFIFRHLPLKDLVKVSNVSKPFRDFSRDDSLWTRLTLDYVDIKQKTDSCRELIERCKKLASLKISNKFLKGNILNIMTVVIRAKESLKSLEVHSSMQTWTPAAMAKLGQIKNLTCLTMSFNSNPLAVQGKEGAKMLEDLAKLDKLEVLNLVISHDSLDRFHNSIQSRINSLPIMKTVFQKLKKLKKVEIYLPASDYDESLVVTLAENNLDLTSLRLMNYPSLSDETIDVLANFCPGLEELNISFRDIDREINKLSSSFPNLKQLFARRCDGLDDEQLVKLAKEFRRLEKLHLESVLLSSVVSGITDSGIERFLGAAKNLKYLRAFYLPQVTKDNIDRLRLEYPDLVLRINFPV